MEVVVFVFVCVVLNVVFPATRRMQSIWVCHQHNSKLWYSVVDCCCLEICPMALWIQSYLLRKWHWGVIYDHLDGDRYFLR